MVVVAKVRSTALAWLAVKRCSSSGRGWERRWWRRICRVGAVKEERGELIARPRRGQSRFMPWGRLQGSVQPQMEAPCLNRGRCVTSHAGLMHAGRGVSKQVRSHEIVEGIDCLKHTVECSKPPAPAGAPTTPSVRDNQRPSQPEDARARESPREPARTRIQ